MNETTPDTIEVGDLTFEFRRSDDRSTVGVTVDRDGSLRLSAPEDCPLETVERVARQKRLWVHRKLAEKRRLNESAVDKEYVSGETFWYLGRRHRLKVADPDAYDEEIPPLGLYQGRFRLREDCRSRARSHFIDWYTDHAEPWLAERLERWNGRMEADVETVEVRDLGNRWGSCRDERVHFHWRTILLPPRIVDYVVVHELAHVHVQHHGDEFWRRVERAMPDYETRKQWLAEEGARFDC